MSKQNEQTTAVASVKPVHVQEQNALEALGVEFTLSSTAPAYPRLPRNKAWFVSAERGTHSCAGRLWSRHCNGCYAIPC